MVAKAAFDDLDPLSYKSLLAVRLKAYRNGSWRRLKGVEKAFFKAALDLARLRGRLVNPLLLSKVKTIISRLLQTPLTRVLQLGREHASRLFELYGRNGVFKWAPSVRNWLKDPNYLLWLGVSQLTLQSLGYV